MFQLIEQGKIDLDARILSEASVRKMAEKDPGSRTLGWDFGGEAKGTKLSDNLMFHTGYSGTFLLMDFDNDLAIVLLANRTYPENTGYKSLIKTRAAVCDAVAEALKLPTRGNC